MIKERITFVVQYKGVFKDSDKGWKDFQSFTEINDYLRAALTIMSEVHDNVRVIRRITTETIVNKV